jgi:ribokinase
VRGPDVVFVGQIARDVVLRVDRLPEPGSSGPVTFHREILGGKGANQAVAFAQLGGRPRLVGVVGDDTAGVELLRQADADGVDVDAVVRRAGASSATIVEILEPEGRWRYLEDISDDMLLTPDDVERVGETFATASAAVLQLQQPVDAVVAAARIARESNAMVVLDGAPPAHSRERALELCDVLRADTHEASLLAGEEIRDGAMALRAARDIRRRGPRVVMLGAGGDGDAVSWPDGEAVFPHSATGAIDTTGAGDALIATLTSHLLRGASPKDAAESAVEAAGVAVRHVGGRPRLTVGSDHEGAVTK